MPQPASQLPVDVFEPRVDLYERHPSTYHGNPSTNIMRPMQKGTVQKPTGRIPTTGIRGQPPLLALEVMRRWDIQRAGIDNQDPQR